MDQASGARAIGRRFRCLSFSLRRRKFCEGTIVLTRFAINANPWQIYSEVWAALTLLVATLFALL